IALDTGKIRSDPYAFCVVYELNSNNPPFLLRLDQIIGTSEDGCIDQVCGHDLSSEKFFLNLLDAYYILPFHCLCACHLTQLVFKKAFEQCQFFTEEINLLHLLATELQKDIFAKLIGARCPAPVDIRWQIYNNFARWILSRAKAIQAIIGEKYHSFIWHIHLLYIVLQPLAALISYFESDSSFACIVIIMCYQALRYYYEIVTNMMEFNERNWRNVIECIADNLKQRYFEGNNGCIYAMLYSMTPAGAISLSLHNLLLDQQLPDSLEKEYIPQLKDFMESMDELMNSNIEYKFSNQENENKNDEEENIQLKDRSLEFVPLRNIKDSKEITYTHHNLRRKDDLKLEQQLEKHLFQIKEPEQNDISAMLSINSIGWYTTCKEEVREQFDFVYGRFEQEISNTQINQIDQDYMFQQEQLQQIKLVEKEKEKEEKVQKEILDQKKDKKNDRQIQDIENKSTRQKKTIQRSSEIIVRKMVQYWQKNRNQVSNHNDLKDGAFQYWDSRSQIPDGLTIVDFTFKTFVTVASEAGCERKISQSKMLVGDKKWRIAKSTLQSIIQVAQKGKDKP
ncbi:MAG: hypothetical protein EZS28_031712, partial [Streblomastix strix]